MSLQTLSKEILALATKESAECKEQIEQEIAQQESKTNEEFVSFSKKQKELFEQERLLAEKQILGKYRLEAKNILLATRKALLEKVEQEALQGICTLSEKEKIVLFTKLFSQAKEAFTITQVQAPTEEIQLVQKIVGKEIMVSQGKQANTIIFIAQNQKESMSFSYEDIIKTIIESREEEIYEALF